MDQVVEVNTDDFDCTVQPGVTRMELNTYLRDTGLWFPIGIELNVYQLKPISRLLITFFSVNDKISNSDWALAK